MNWIWKKIPYYSWRIRQNDQELFEIELMILGTLDVYCASVTFIFSSPS
jgi:hypothetical protein